MNTTLILQELIVGLATGAIYSLIALGYTMVYGIIELINFAHGDVFMIGSLMAIAVMSLLGINAASPPVGFALVAILLFVCVATMVICALLGVAIERVAYRPLRNAPRLAPLISAIGISLILEDVGKLWKGVTYVPFPQIFPQVTYTLGPLSINAVDIFVFVVACVLMVVLQWFVQGTSIGRAMRAVAQDREAAALMGVNVDRIIAITFFIGAALAGAAGFIYGLKYGSTIFYIGYRYGLIAFTAAVLGGIGNIFGAMVGGIVIGIIEAEASLISDSILPHGGSAWSGAIIFAILILILIFRPSGLFGQHTPDKV
ncbi:branched-chain amino acid ABC transporter permease [Tengunoibacter tsumagoiensis]|uniref:Branched-chain amino acid ABC transporter permease n=1 Tax=Tengunoibacter tsumagoiensis TaxID=2014871 RepID=A0A402A0W4_9CHLR|nr:branched-chain amino acid ABC transporter permease [Tengunoibacter tsumagoiensis]GCE12754.1 branched-chain amino acid ABC transporter permease [Tengunoibacter tsumagoiensis]